MLLTLRRRVPDRKQAEVSGKGKRGVHTIKESSGERAHKQASRERKRRSEMFQWPVFLFFRLLLV